jgi:hypothetical protein
LVLPDTSREYVDGAVVEEEPTPREPETATPENTPEIYPGTLLDANVVPLIE